MTPCDEWTGAKNRGGYGRICIARQAYLAHRVVWMQDHGPIPDGLVVMHSCDNPACINIDHLSLGTHADNANDRHKKGRTNTGHWQRSRTHCPQGHPYDNGNTYVNPAGARVCRTCAAIRDRKRKDRMIRERALKKEFPHAVA